MKGVTMTLDLGLAAHSANLGNWDEECATIRSHRSRCLSARSVPSSRGTSKMAEINTLAASENGTLPLNTIRSPGREGRTSSAISSTSEACDRNNLLLVLRGSSWSESLHNARSQHGKNDGCASSPPGCLQSQCPVTPGQKERNAIAALGAVDDDFCIDKHSPALAKIIQMTEDKPKLNSHLVQKHPNPSDNALAGGAPPPASSQRTQPERPMTQNSRERASPLQFQQDKLSLRLDSMVLALGSLCGQAQLIDKENQDTLRICSSRSSSRPQVPPCPQSRPHTARDSTQSDNLGQLQEYVRRGGGREGWEKEQPSACVKFAPHRDSLRGGQEPVTDIRCREHFGSHFAPVPVLAKAVRPFSAGGLPRRLPPHRDATVRAAMMRAEKGLDKKVMLGLIAAKGVDGGERGKVTLRTFSYKAQA